VGDRLSEYNERRTLEAARKRVRRRSRYGTDARARKITGKPCRVCGDPDVEYHHIVPRSAMPGSPDVAHVANAMPLCHMHHQAHHTTVAGRIPRRLLTPDEVEFVRTRMGVGWLDRWYPA
jgi:5-methylcytosine-specific restriction endonuclease McrA